MGKRLSFTFFIIKVNKIFKIIIIIIIIGNSIRWEAKWKTSTFVQEMLASYICIILWGPMNKYILQWKCGFGAWEETIMFSCNTSTKDHWLLLENHQNVNWISYSYIYITKRKCEWNNNAFVPFTQTVGWKEFWKRVGDIAGLDTEFCAFFVHYPA